MLGMELKLYRVRNGLSQADLASRLGVAQNSVSQWENGKRSPTLRKVAKIASVLGCPVEALFPVEVGGKVSASGERGEEV